MKKQKNYWDNFRFEFALYINEDPKDYTNKKPIVCQRSFDVKNFNEDVVNSIEIKDLMDSLTGTNGHNMGLIPNYLKQISKKNCWREYNPYRVVDIDDTRGAYSSEDVFTFEIKVDNKLVAKSSFSGTWLHTAYVKNFNDRYEINIKEIIPEIIKEIEYYFSKDAYTTSYAGYELEK